jgi:serine phosphatase RsbU (regulator of sigma subunit)
MRRSAHLSAQEIIQSLHDEVVAFAGSARQLDDTTAVVIRRSP